MTYLMLLCALALSGVAAFYAIFGLVAIFAAAPIPIIIMGSLLETSKLVVASWLYRNWKLAPGLMKTYLTVALIILMFLTSMGIFGFLSKAHIEQGTPTGDIAASVSLIEEKIKTEREIINDTRKALNQLDAQVNKFTELGNVTRGIQARQQQQKERDLILKQIDASQSIIARLNEERAAKATSLRKVEAEVGPIKYIAALIYGEEASSDTSLLEKAVRWMILLLVAVFDPLAVLMLIAANWSFAQRKPPVIVPQEPEEPKEPEKPTEPVINPAPERREPVINKPQYNFTTTVNPPLVPVVQSTSIEHPAFQPNSTYWISRPRTSPRKSS